MAKPFPRRTLDAIMMDRNHAEAVAVLIDAVLRRSVVRVNVSLPPTCWRRSTVYPTTGPASWPKRRAKNSSTYNPPSRKTRHGRRRPNAQLAGTRYADECLKRSAQAANHVRILREVAYGTDPRQRMDIFLPRQPGLRNLPVLLFMHGGGWTLGTKDWNGFMAPPLVDLPAIFVSVGYRLIPSVSFPTPVLDCVAALRWIADHIAEHGGSPHRLFVGGHSAGGQIAALMALHPDWLHQAGLPPNAISRLLQPRHHLQPPHDQPGQRPRPRAARPADGDRAGQPAGTDRGRDSAILHLLGRPRRRAPGAHRPANDRGPRRRRMQRAVADPAGTATISAST